MSNTVEYHQSTTPEPYESAPMPEGLIFEEYQFFAEEHATMEEKHAEAVGVHEEWKAAKAKVAQLEKLRLDKEVQLEKLRVLKSEEEQKAEEKRKEEEQIRLEAEKAMKDLKEKEEAAEHKRLEDLEAKEKEKEKEDEAAGAPSASEGDSEGDPADLKAIAMAELRRKCEIAKRKKSMVEDSEEDGNALVGPSTRKRLKTEPAPQANDKVFSGNVRCGKCWADKAHCFIRSSIWTCQQCHVRKARCSFNKGDDSGSVDSSSIMELLQDISSRLARLEDKVEHIAGHMEDLMDE